MGIEQTKILFAWSGGKDSSMALWKLQQDAAFEVVGLLVTGNKNTQRISMHGVRLDLARKQAKSIGLPLIEVLVDDNSYDGYEHKMSESLKKAMTDFGIEGVAFGDIFLEDLRQYREEKMALLSLKTYFPLWKKDTGLLVQEFLNSGFRTILCCVSDGPLDASFVGQELSAKLIESFPGAVDPCGENGEYHTFCFDGPIFKEKISFEVGEKVFKPLEEQYHDSHSGIKGFWFVDLI